VINSVTSAIVQRIDYDAFGNVTLDTSPGFQPFGFAGGLYDPDTGLVRFAARDYDPRIGQWTAKDPSGFAGRDANLYRYANNDPVNLVDRTGSAPTQPNPFEDLERMITRIERVFNPETDEPMESAADFAKRRNQISKARRLANAAKNAAYEAGQCAQNAANAAKKGVKGLLGVLGFIDVGKVIVDSIETGREPTLKELVEAYLGYPVDPLPETTPGVI
jgi:RHS repeat-associated protein